MVDVSDLLLGKATPITKLPRSRDPEDDVGVRFVALSKEICDKWQHVQWAIDRDETERADKGWNWHRLRLLQKLSTSRRQCRGAALVITDPATGHEIPIGLTLLVTPFPHLSNHSKNATFLWFLSEMPRGIRRFKTIPLPKMIGSALLDYALTVSFSHELHGRVGLHAAPEGGERLLGWYSKRKMAELPSEQALPGIRGVLLRNDGRYFIYEPRGSIDAFGLMSDWR
jgi:hypothetical protein